MTPGVPREERRATRAVHRVHRATSSPWIAIAVGAAVVVIWAVIALLRFDTDVQVTFASVCAGVTVTMVFVLQHTQRREQTALQLKLDELIRALPQTDEHLIGVEASPDDELFDLQTRHLEEHVELRDGTN